MSSEMPPITIPHELFWRMKRMVSDCRSIAFEANKEYVYYEAVQLEKDVQAANVEYQKTLPDYLPDEE